MTREEMLLRFGFYCGRIGRLLGDNSYAERWHGRAHELTEVDYMRETTEIQGHLVAAGLLGPDEDPLRGVAMKRMIGGIFVGILVGSVAGRLQMLLPPFWSVVFAFVISLVVTFWAISSMRELDRRKRVIDEILASLANTRESPARKDLGLPLQ